MASLKQLQGIAHDIAHHAQSGVSFLHPHLAQMCRQADVVTAAVELMAERPYPEGLGEWRPLEAALGVLRERLIAVLEAHGLSAVDIRSAHLVFLFRRGGTDYDCSVCSRLEDLNGRVYYAEIGFITP